MVQCMGKQHFLYLRVAVQMVLFRLLQFCFKMKGCYLSRLVVLQLQLAMK